jgi:hypothetical protein
VRAGKPECDLVRFVAFGGELGGRVEFACGKRLDGPDIKPDGLTLDYDNVGHQARKITSTLALKVSALTHNEANTGKPDYLYGTLRNKTWPVQLE